MQTAVTLENNNYMNEHAAAYKRKDLLEQAFGVIMELDDYQLKCLLERMGYLERKAV